MKIRRAQQLESLTHVPLDGVDMFLLSLVEDEIALWELTDIAPRSALECLRRVLRLAQLGLLQLRFDTQDERLLAQGCDESAAQELLDNASTLRPPPVDAFENRQTLRPARAPAALLSQQVATTTGIRRRPTPPAGEPVKVDKTAS